jgi:hypothetical protein
MHSHVAFFQIVRLLLLATFGHGTIAMHFTWAVVVNLFVKERTKGECKEGGGGK